MAIKNIDLSNLDEEEEIAFLGERSDTSGHCVSGIGDINDDKFDDIVIGAPGCSEVDNSYTTCRLNNYAAGAAYVVFGGRNISNINLASLSPPDGFKIIGVNASHAGFSVRMAGDVNKDGHNDTIIGAPGIASSPGVSYIIFGKPKGFVFSDIDLAKLEPSQGVAIYGASAGDRSGWSVSGAGDVNCDKIDDVIIGAPYANASSGKSYIIFGNINITSTIYLSNLTSSQGVTIYGASHNDRSGWAVRRAGDVNHKEDSEDNCEDVIIGAPFADSNTGVSYVIFGNKTLSNIDLNKSLSSWQGFTITGKEKNDYSGLSVSGAGDFDSNGNYDVIISAPAASLSEGISYIIFGSENPTNIKLSEPADQKWISISGSSLVDYSGAVVSYAGDVNGDDIGDVVIGAPGATDGGTTYVLFGSNNPKDVHLKDLSGDVNHNSQGFSIVGAKYGDKLGFSVGWVGNFNGDKYDDIIAGAVGGGFFDNGLSYVVFGDKMPKEENYILTEVEKGLIIFAGAVIGVIVLGGVAMGSCSYYNHHSLQQTINNIGTGLEALLGGAGGGGGGAAVPPPALGGGEVAGITLAGVIVGGIIGGIVANYAVVESFE